MTAALDTHLSEHQLVARMARDDRSALQSLYEAYYPHLYKLFAHLAVTKERQEIEQLVEDTMMEVWLSRNSFIATRSVYAWIMRKALNQPFHSRPEQSSLLKTLTTAERAVVHFVYTGHSRKQIAEILEVNPDDVDELLYQARARMRPTGH